MKKFVNSFNSLLPRLSVIYIFVVAYMSYSHISLPEHIS